MVGVGETVYSKDIGQNEFLCVHMDWESDDTLIAPNDRVDGQLAGRGVTFYTIGIKVGRNQDFKTELRTFQFRGGGDLKPKDFPGQVKVAADDLGAKYLANRAEPPHPPPARTGVDSVKQLRDDLVKALSNLEVESPKTYEYAIVPVDDLHSLYLTAAKMNDSNPDHSGGSYTQILGEIERIMRSTDRVSPEEMREIETLLSRLRKAPST